MQNDYILSNIKLSTIVEQNKKQNSNIFACGKNNVCQFLENPGNQKHKKNTFCTMFYQISENFDF